MKMVYSIHLGKESCSITFFKGNEIVDIQQVPIPQVFPMKADDAEFMTIPDSPWPLTGPNVLRRESLGYVYQIQNIGGVWLKYLEAA